MNRTGREPVPAGVWVSAGFFVLSGVLEIALTLWELRPLAFLPAWDAVGRGLLHFLVALGLWRRSALCRSIAMVYCLASIVTYLSVIAMALAHAWLRVPTSVVLQSLYQVPSCALLLPYLRSAEASLVFTRPLFGP